MRPIGNLSRYTGGPLRRRGEWRCFMKSRKCSEQIRWQFESTGYVATS